jgi:hypothetical protein
MKRLNQMRFYHLGKIGILREINLPCSSDRFREITLLPSFILEMFAENEENKASLPIAVEKAQKIIGTLTQIYTSGREVVDTDGHTVNFLLSQFETSLEDEFQRLPAYLVDPVGAYSFDRLIGAADTVFPENLRKALIPEQVATDFRSAGRCLAFDLPTACGFHAFRATDAMLREYCKHFGAVPSGNSRDWGTFIRELKKVLTSTATKKPNERTVELIDSIRAQDRNPLVHPELNLDSDGALLMFDLCKNAVSLMATDIKNAP